MAEKDNREIPIPPQSPIKWNLWFILCVLLFGIMLYFFYVYPTRAIGPKQPIPFSHRIHAGVKRIDCKFCHPFVESGPRASLPPTEKCFFCHTYIIPTHPEIEKEKRHLTENDPIVWRRVFYIPDFVQFNHLPHIHWAQLDCIQCHGDAKKMDRLPYVAFEMGFCINCHKTMNAQTDCWLACHH